MLLENTIHLGDCLELMKEIPDVSVDLVLCDLPYGTTSRNAWDSIIPLEALWAQYGRLLKPCGAVVLTAAQPFTSALVMSNPAIFKYAWVWEKSRPVGFLNAKKQPLRGHEDVLVFYKKLGVYNPQGTTPCFKVNKRSTSGTNYHEAGLENTQTVTNYPRSVLHIASESGTIHPTQKPVALWEYLIKTYTNPGDLVLDNFAGSGTTAVACKQTGRRYLCIEKDREYWLKACERVNQSPVASIASQTVLEPKTEPPLA